MSKEKGAQSTVWSHHETMVVNLRDWVNRELNKLRTDITKDVPDLIDDPYVSKTMKAAEDMNVQLFDLVRSVLDLAEKKAKAKQKVVTKAETKSEPEEELVG